MKLKIETASFEVLENELRVFRKKALPFATRNTINNMAFLGQKQTQKNIEKEFTLRNKFTTRSIRVDKEKKELNINKQRAVMGSIAPYMAEQEFGASIRKKGKHGVPVPTTDASGEPEGAQERLRRIRKARYISAIRLEKRRPTNRGQNTLIGKVHRAIRTKRRFFFHDFGRSKGIYRVIGGGRTKKRGWPKGARIRKVYDLSKTVITIDKTPTVHPAAVEVMRTRFPLVYRSNLIEQIRRAGILGG